MNLELFVSDGDVASTKTMTQVFVQNGYKCATDGRMAVRVKCDYPDTEGNFPDMRSCFDVDIKKISPVKIVMPKTDGSRCDMCDHGKITFNVKCLDCNGTGKCTCLCETKHNCGICKGKGKVPTKQINCPYCDGNNTGFYDLEIEGKYFKGHFVKLACQELSNLTAVGTNSDGAMLILEHDEGDCAIMAFLK